MVRIEKLPDVLRGEKASEVFRKLYGEKPAVLEKQAARYRKAIENFRAAFPGKTVVQLFSTPGRTEVGGNHTDHNAGRVLAAAVDLDVIAVVSANDTGIITVQSEGYPVDVLDTRQLAPVKKEKYSFAALIRGICARLRDLGYNIGGFDAYTTSNVLKGSGLSSSAAFEVLIVCILNHLYNNGRIDDIQNARIVQYAENEFFGKPCGLMDQTTCAVGGFVTIDFLDFDNPKVEKVDFDFTLSGFSMVIVDTGGNHADLNEDYSALEHEMKEVARAFGGQVLREFSAEKILENIAYLRTRVNDRAILRALHFYQDDLRVVRQVQALQEGDFDTFQNLVIESGVSSWMLCQNCYSCSSCKEQGISVALTVAESLLKGRGSWRVHGGGFAGTIQAFVPEDLLGTYVDKMKGIFGEKSCYELMIRPVGAVRLELL